MKLGRIGYKIGKAKANPKHLAHKEYPSICVADLTFDPLANICTCVFQERGTYNFMNMTPDVFAEWNTAGSRGTYFNLYIRGQYESQRIS